MSDARGAKQATSPSHAKFGILQAVFLKGALEIGLAVAPLANRRPSVITRAQLSDLETSRFSGSNMKLRRSLKCRPVFGDRTSSRAVPICVHPSLELKTMVGRA